MVCCASAGNTDSGTAVALPLGSMKVWAGHVGVDCELLHCPFLLLLGKYYYEAIVTDEGLCRIGWSTQAGTLELGMCVRMYVSYTLKFPQVINFRIFHESVCISESKNHKKCDCSYIPDKQNWNQTVTAHAL